MSNRTIETERPTQHHNGTPEAHSVAVWVKKGELYGFPVTEVGVKTCLEGTVF